MLSFKKIPVSLKLGSILFILGVLLLTFLFLLLIPNINNKQYKNAIEQNTKMVDLTKHQVRLLVDYLREYRSFLRISSKNNIVDFLDRTNIKYEANNKNKEIVFLDDLKTLNKNYNCNIKYLENGVEKLFLPQSKVNRDFNFENIAYNKWHHIKGKVVMCPSDKYFLYKTMIKDKELRLSCNSVLENNYKDVEIDVKKVVQDGFALTKNIHKGKTYLMWLNNNLDKSQYNKTLDMLSNTDSENYCLSRISNLTEPLTGDIKVGEILNIKDTKLIEHSLNGKVTLTWISNIYSDEKEDFVLIFSAYKDDFQKHLDNPVWKIIPISLIALLLSIIIAFLLFRKWLNNITKLSSTAREICGGKLNVRSNIKGEDDIGVLGVAFDTMLDKLEDNINNLDKKVEQRTQELEESLNSKEILLKEIHHRVKNNLSLTIYFIKLQKFKIEDEELQEVLSDIESRIYTMSLLHTKLYESENLDSIDLKRYICDLVNDISQSYDISEIVDINLDIEKIFLNINYALPCGLIINECLTNSFKYAFDENGGNISIVLKNIEKHIILEISDSGKGLADNIDINTATTLGLRLISTIAKSQLLGSIDYSNEGRSKFIIKFKYK